MDDGRIGHAELPIADGVLYLADEYRRDRPESADPQATSVSLMLHVADTDAALDRAREPRRRGAAGALRELRCPHRHHPSTRSGIAGCSAARYRCGEPIQHGDVGYVSVWTPDADRAAAFYGRVLGWTYDPARPSRSPTPRAHRHLQRRRRSTLFCCYAVADLDGARHGDHRRRRHGSTRRGSSTSARVLRRHRLRRGSRSGCSTRIRVSHVRSSTALGRANFRTSPTRWPTRRAFRAFYSRGAVLDLRARPHRRRLAGRAEPTRWPASPAARSRSSTVPMWTVDDIDAAVARVREAGGTVIERAVAAALRDDRRECTDDQGSRFYLGEF